MLTYLATHAPYLPHCVLAVCLVALAIGGYVLGVFAHYGRDTDSERNL